MRKALQYVAAVILVTAVALSCGIETYLLYVGLH